jgi:Flp pilus assembly protein TadB
MRYIQLLILAILLSGTAAMYSQDFKLSVPQSASSQRLTDALQDQRIEQLKEQITRNKQSINGVLVEIASIRSSVDRFTGIGIGIGSVLAVLQVLLILINYRNGKAG